MRRPWLIASLMVLLALNARNAIELIFLLFHARRHAALERLAYGSTLYWGTWVLVLCFDLGALWLTVRVAKCPRDPYTPLRDDAR